MALQIPQYFFITAGEVMFSVTGLEFSYSQVREATSLLLIIHIHFLCFLLYFTFAPFLCVFKAPNNMKAVLQAGWLLTVAVGNFIVLIVAEIAKLPEQVSFNVLPPYQSHNILRAVTTGINIFIDNNFVFSLFSSFKVDWVHPVCLSPAGGVYHLLSYGVFLHIHWSCRNWGSV